MDKQTTVIEALRLKLQDLPRREVLVIADAAKVARSTVEKFRLNRITEPKASKVERLRKALTAFEAKAA